MIARCLGADSVVFGRPSLYGVAVAGQPGVARALQIMREEIDKVLTQMGCGVYKDLDAGYLWPELARGSTNPAHRAPMPAVARVIA